MDTKPSHTYTSLPQGPMQQSSLQQELTNSHQPPSQSSQTYTTAPSGTGASARSATVATENFDPVAYETIFAYHMQALSADEQDLSLVGSWTAVDPHDTVLIENDPILSQIHRLGAVDFARNNAETTDRNEGENTEEAVGIFKASLRRKVPKEQSTCT